MPSRPGTRTGDNNLKVPMNLLCKPWCLSLCHTPSLLSPGLAVLMPVTLTTCQLRWEVKHQTGQRGHPVVRSSAGQPFQHHTLSSHVLRLPSCPPVSPLLRTSPPQTYGEEPQPSLGLEKHPEILRALPPSPAFSPKAVSSIFLCQYCQTLTIRTTTTLEATGPTSLSFSGPGPQTA